MIADVIPLARRLYMARNSKGSHRIVVGDIEYRWRATGNDGWISVNIWPADGVGPLINTSFGYHETMDQVSESHWTSRGDQIIVTNRLVRRVIELAISDYSYLPTENGPQLQIRQIESQIDWDDAVRASDQG